MYIGYTRISRSLYIAKHCKGLAIEAYKAAIQDIQQNTRNTAKYTHTVECLNEALQSKGQPPVSIDQDWINQVQRENKALLDSLESELKAAKGSLNKEEIRRCHIKLGDYYYKKGDLPSAMKNYVRTRDYCMTSQNVLDMCFNTIKVNHVNSFIESGRLIQTITPRSIWTIVTFLMLSKHIFLEQNQHQTFQTKPIP